MTELNVAIIRRFWEPCDSREMSRASGARDLRIAVHHRGTGPHSSITPTGIKGYYPVGRPCPGGYRRHTIPTGRGSTVLYVNWSADWSPAFDWMYSLKFSIRRRGGNREAARHGPATEGDSNISHTSSRHVWACNRSCVTSTQNTPLCRPPP